MVEAGEIVPLPDNPELKWFSPGPELALDLENSPAGFVLQLNSRQLYRGGQLELWHKLGWLDDRPADKRQLKTLEDPEATLEERARSYIDANCANCHRPGGPSRGFFDARFTTPLSEQNLVNGKLMAGDLGIPGAKVIVPGSPEKSILFQRMKRHDAFRMPPVAVNHHPSPALPIIEEWIRHLGEGK